MSIGPFTLTGDVSIVNLASLITLILLGWKLVSHLSKVNDQVEALWQAVMGKGPQDRDSFFYRFAVVEKRVNEIWERRDGERSGGNNWNRQ